MNESHFLGLLLIHQEIDGLALVAEFSLRIDDLRIDLDQISYLLRGFCTYGQLWLYGRDSLAELHIQLDSIAACL